MNADPIDPKEIALDNPLTWTCSSKISIPMIDSNGKIGPINIPQPNNDIPSITKYTAECEYMAPKRTTETVNSIVDLIKNLTA